MDNGITRIIILIVCLISSFTTIADELLIYNPDGSRRYSGFDICHHFYDFNKLYQAKQISGTQYHIPGFNHYFGWQLFKGLNFEFNWQAAQSIEDKGLIKQRSVAGLWCIEFPMFRWTTLLLGAGFGLVNLEYIHKDYYSHTSVQFNPRILIAPELQLTPSARIRFTLSWHDLNLLSSHELYFNNSISLGAGLNWQY